MKSTFFNFLFTLLLVGVSLSTLFAQGKGTISGSVSEAATKAEVIGAAVYIKELNLGIVTDYEGNFVFRNLNPGTYTIECSYLGFAKMEKTNIIVKAGETTTVQFGLKEAEMMTTEVVVEAKMTRNTEASLLTIKSQSSSVVDGISAAQITKSGDNDAAAAVRRITGITVEGGKYVYVRGLGDRYSKTTLNGAEIPGLDPNRNTIQMDLFPSSLLDNILVYKSFTPNLYGDFTGGYVDLATKDFPERFTFNASASLSYNSLTTFNRNFLTYEGGRYDALGFDDGSRAIPAIVNGLDQFPTYRPTNSGNFNAAEAQLLEDVTRSFTNNWSFQRKAAPLNQNFSVSLGNQTKLFGRPLGFVAATTYQRSFSGYEGGNYGIYELTGMVDQTNRLTTQMQLKDEQGTEDVLWGAMLSAGYKINKYNQLGLTILRNQSATSTASFAQGTKPVDDPDDIFQTRSWRFSERSMTTYQLRGAHTMPALNNMEMKWQSSYSVSTQDDPDLRYFSNRIEPGGVADIKTSDNPPSRFYRDMKQANTSNRLDFSMPFNQWAGLKSKINFGATHGYQNRSFRENRYVMKEVGIVPFDGNPATYFSSANLIDFNPEENVYSNNGNGIIAQQGIDSANNYNAYQSVLGTFLMVDMPIIHKLRFVGGVRAEKTALSLYSFDASLRNNDTLALDGKTKLLDNLDFLPSVNLTYDLSDKMKLRASYGRTLARPTFRELAPYTSFDVDGGYLLAGNPKLLRTTTDNLDLRWEFMPTFAELISAGVFYKKFSNPIERTFNPAAPNSEITFRNVPTATLMGLELELRKNLGFIAETFSNFSFAANFTYIYSQTSIDPLEYNEILATDPSAKGTREMFGQSPFSVNAALSYKNEKGTSFNLTYNLVGPRISVIVRGATPNVYERSRSLLGVNFSQEFAKNFQFKVAANNLLNTVYRESMIYKDVEYFVKKNPIGMSFSVGLSYNIKGKEKE